MGFGAYFYVCIARHVPERRPLPTPPFAHPPFHHPLPTGIQKLLAKVPSAMCEASIPGIKSFGLGSRMACLLVKFCEYSLAGMFCGLVGQGVVNAAIDAK